VPMKISTDAANRVRIPRPRRLRTSFSMGALSPPRSGLRF
jgi:hypothetical protein